MALRILPTGSGGGGGGGSTSLTVGVTPVTAGVTQRILFDNGAVLGELIVGANLSIAAGALNAVGGTANIVVNSSTVTGGVSGGVLYANGAVVGQMTNTGTGTVNVLQTSPLLITPNLGTPTAGVLSACSGYSATALTGNLPYASFVNATAPSVVVGRGSAAGPGVFQELTFGTNISVSGTVINVTAGGGAGDVVGPASAVDSEIAVFSGTTGKLLKRPGLGSGIVRSTAGVLSVGPVSLTADVNGLLPFSSIANTSAGSILLGRSAGVAGPIQEITLGTNLSFSGGVLNATGGGGGSLAVGSSPITSGNAGRILFHDTGDVLGEVAATGTGNVALSDQPVFTTNITTPLVRTAFGVNLTLAPLAPGVGANSVAGASISVTASNATAGVASDAAAGGGLSFRTGDAARNGAGNADGGSFSFVTGVPVGTGSSGNMTFATGIDAVGTATGASTGFMSFSTGINSITGGASGNLTFQTGNNTATGSSGNILIQTGVANSAAGDITIRTQTTVSNTASGAGNLIFATGGSTGTKTTSPGINGGAMQFTTHQGMNCSAATGVGGNGGTWTWVGGVGGNASGATAPTGGIGAGINFTCGNGGNVSGAAANKTPGNGGTMIFNAGVAGTGASGTGVGVAVNGSIVFQIGGVSNVVCNPGRFSIVQPIDFYNGVFTAGWGIPAIYASGRQVGVVAVAPATIASYTVGAADGSFLVSANVKVTTSGSEAFAVNCVYTDEDNVSRTMVMQFQLVAGTTVVTSVAAANGAVPYMGKPSRIRCKAGTTITLGATGTFTGCTYNIEGDVSQVK